MVSNEVFIDSATLRENVVALARNIGYVPRSETGAKARITFTLSTANLSTNPVQITLKRGVVATTRATNQSSYTYTIPADITVPVEGDLATFTNIEICEGTYLTQTYTVSASNPNQRFILDNSNIDTSSIRVSVDEDGTGPLQAVTYTLANSLSDVTDKSRVFFIQEIEDERYELIFGDGVFGRKLEAPATITVNYNITHGESANGASSFRFSGRLVDNDGNVVNAATSLIKTEQEAIGGSKIESIASIKKYAPKIYSSQNRAVTANDYEALIPQIYPARICICLWR